MDLKRHVPVYHSLSKWDSQDQLGSHLQFHLQLQWDFQYKSDDNCKPTPVYQIWLSLWASLGAEMELHFKISPDWGLNPSLRAVLVSSRFFLVISRLFLVSSRLGLVSSRFLVVSSRLFLVSSRFLSSVYDQNMINCWNCMHSKACRKLVIPRLFLVISRLFLVIWRFFLVIPRILLVSSRLFLVISRFLAVSSRFFLVISRFVSIYILIIW